MARTNCMGLASNTPGQAKPVRVQNGHTAGRFVTPNSDTAANTKDKGRPEKKISTD